MLQIADYGRGLPDEFYKGLYQLHDSPPNGSPVGHYVKDYGRDGGWRLVRFGSDENNAVGKLYSTNRKIFHGTFTNVTAPTRGQSTIKIRVNSADVAGVNDFARGSVMFNNGVLSGRRFYISGSKAKDTTDNGVEVDLDRPIPMDVLLSDDVTLFANKYTDVILADSNNANNSARIPVGGSLIESPRTSKYGWLQCKGLGPGYMGVDMAAAVQDGTPLKQGADGALILQADTNLKPVLAYFCREDDDIDVSAQAVHPVEWAIPTEF